MSQHGIIKRYTLIIEKVSYNQYPSFELIHDFLFEHGFEISKRTLQRDIEQIRYEYGLEIEYNRGKKGYFINSELSFDIESFFRFLEIVNTANLLTDSLKESKDSLNYISFDKGGGFKGIDNIKVLLQAIKERKKISFKHYNFHTKKWRKYVLNPYLLKEYQNRWYVIGTYGKTKHFMTYGVDRIEDLKIKAEVFKKNNSLNPKKDFDDIIGLYYSNDKAENVVLSFTPTQGNYVKTLPLHKSQEILIDDNKELRVSINVIPNFELQQQILKYGDSVKVIKPQYLVDEIKDNLERTLKKYK